MYNRKGRDIDNGGDVARSRARQIRHERIKIQPPLKLLYVREWSMGLPWAGEEGAEPTDADGPRVHPVRLEPLVQHGLQPPWLIHTDAFPTKNQHTWGVELPCQPSLDSPPLGPWHSLEASSYSSGVTGGRFLSTSAQ